MSCQAGRALRLPQGLVEADDHARARGGAAADGVHGGGEGEGAVVGGEEVGEREGGHLAEERGAARAGGEVDVVAGAVAVRPVLGVADQAEDAEPRVHGVQGLAVEPELLLGASKRKASMRPSACCTNWWKAGTSFESDRLRSAISFISFRSEYSEPMDFAPSGWAGFSTLITRAPRCARSFPTNGPGSKTEQSKINLPFRSMFRL